MNDIVIVGISYNCEITGEIKQILKADYKRILVTHEPPFKILDLGKYKDNIDENGDLIGNIGNKKILELVNECKPNIHIFGHSHTMGQRKKLIGNTLFTNVASVSRLSIYENIYTGVSRREYTGVYGILDTDTMDIELKCLHSRDILCERCGEKAYIPRIWRGHKCSNCRESKSLDIEDLR